jgi:glycerol-3-phosphate acyltransferase PlsY
MERLICIIIGYIFGLFQTSYIYGRLNHIDIREHGSGNAGTTNAMRTLGKRAGVITFIGDFVKSIIASLIVRLVFADSTVDITLLILYSGIGAVLGHSFPIYLKFKGGKGVAASAGVIFSLLDARFVIIGLIIFIAVTLISKHVSLGSLTLLGTFFIEFVIFGQLNMIKLTNPYKLESYILVFLITLLVFIQHRANIVRLINGTERKIGQKKEG